MPGAMFHHDDDFISIYFAYQTGTSAYHKVHIRLRIVIHRSETINNGMPIKLFLSLLTDKCHRSQLKEKDQLVKIQCKLLKTQQ